MFSSCYVSLLVTACVTCVRTKPVGENATSLTIIHINDFHARFEETSDLAGPCKTGDCIGGYSRLVTVVKELQEKYKDENPMYLNAGDNYQGTPWYSLWRWNVTSHFLNMLPADAMAIGNHEFDHGIDGLVPFLNTSKSPMLLANIDEKSSVTLRNLTRPMTILERSGLKIGVIGLIVKDVNEIANTGDLHFLDEINSTKRYVAALKGEGVSIVILLTHCGLDRDKEIARNVDDIDVIVGGHSHTHMYTGKSVGPDTPLDVYPAVVERNGQKTLIVQTSGHAKYVGLLNVKFNSKGEVTSWTGNPIFLSKDIAQDPTTLKEIERWRAELGDSMSGIIGYTVLPLQMDKCKLEECLLGDVISDSMVHAWKGKLDAHGHPLTLTAFVNAGAIRTSLLLGDVSYGDVLTLSPFGNTIDIIKVSGEIILAALEHAVSKKEENVFRGYLQMSGCKVVYDLSKDIGQRVARAEILNPRTRRYRPVKVEANYHVVINSFIGSGGDGFIMFKNATLVERGPRDSDALVDYISFSSPLYRLYEGRIKFFDSQNSETKQVN